MQKLNFEDLLKNKHSIVESDLMAKITGGTKENCHCITVSICCDDNGDGMMDMNNECTSTTTCE